MAIERNTGARGLRSIMEGVMQKIMYEIPSADDIAEVIITKDCVRGISEPTKVIRVPALPEPEVVEESAPEIAEALEETLPEAVNE